MTDEKLRLIKTILIVFGIVNVMLIIGGMLLPWLISNDTLPAVGIVFLVTTIIYACLSFGAAIIHWQLTKLDNTIPADRKPNICQKCDGSGRNIEYILGSENTFQPCKICHSTGLVWQ